MFNLKSRFLCNYFKNQWDYFQRNKQQFYNLDIQKLSINKIRDIAFILSIFKNASQGMTFLFIKPLHQYI